MSAVNWAAYRACHKCIAQLGEPCRVLSGFRDGPVEVAADKPHQGRQLRTGYTRTGGNRG